MAGAALRCEGPPITFTELPLSADYDYAWGVAAADIDGDGDPDLTSADAGRDALCWFENDGSGGFTRHFIRQSEPGWFERHVATDLNGDGFPDVVVVKNLDGDIVWFENDGTPRDGDPWVRRVITSVLSNAYDVAVGDLDLDGDLDVAASSVNNTNGFRWFENPGDPTQEEWPWHLVAIPRNGRCSPPQQQTAPMFHARHSYCGFQRRRLAGSTRCRGRGRALLVRELRRAGRDRLDRAPHESRHAGAW